MEGKSSQAKARAPSVIIVLFRQLFPASKWTNNRVTGEGGGRVGCVKRRLHYCQEATTVSRRKLRKPFALIVTEDFTKCAIPSNTSECFIFFT